ncbi:MAG: nucleotidyl transferase AbiEii/AbiGii toxin family protein, partial [Candidatus Dormibacteria bacterium]
LQRQIAYDRLLERLYLVDGGWIVKGATALLARDLSLRATIDLDLYRNADGQVAETELRAAAARDIGDWFRFELGASHQTAGDTPGTRVPVKAYVGTTPWQEFGIDLVGADIRMTGDPEEVPPLARVAMPDFEQRGYRAYPLVDHVADTVLATFQRYGIGQRPSTRYRDLIDLVAIVRGASVSAEAQLTAFTSEADRRGIQLPGRFSVPDRGLWEAGYAREAARSVLPIARTLDEALALVSPFIDPVLDATAAGVWDAPAKEWRT